MRHLSIEEYARLSARLSKPFAVPAEELSRAGVTQTDFDRAAAQFAAELKSDSAIRERFVRAYEGRLSEAVNPDETAMGVCLSPQPVLPFVEGVWAPPAAALEPRAPQAANADPDATQHGALATDVTLPFAKSPLYPQGGKGR